MKTLYRLLLVLLAPPVGADTYPNFTPGNDLCTGSTGSSQNVCSTLGVPFVASATVDTTNASNIASGTLSWDRFSGSSTRINSTTTLSIASTDGGNYLHQMQASSWSCTIPAIGTANIVAGKFQTILYNDGAGVGTCTPTTSTINGLSALTVPAGSAWAITAESSSNYLAVPLGGGSVGASLGANIFTATQKISAANAPIILNDTAQSGTNISLWGIDLVSGTNGQFRIRALKDDLSGSTDAINCQRGPSGASTGQGVTVCYFGNVASGTLYSFLGSTASFNGTVKSPLIVANGTGVGASGQGWINQPATNQLGFGTGTTLAGYIDASQNLDWNANINLTVQTQPAISWRESGGGTDGNIWDFDAVSNVFRLRTLTDAYGAGVNVLSATRTNASTAVPGIQLGFGATAVTLAGTTGSVTLGPLNTAGIVTNTSGGLLGTATTVPVANGGTNLASYAIGDIVYASGSTTLSKLADVATGSVLVSGGVTTAPAWSTTPTVTGLMSAAGFAPTSSTVSGNRINLPGTNQLGFVTNGKQAGLFDANQNLNLNGVQVATGTPPVVSCVANCVTQNGNTGFTVTFTNGSASIGGTAMTWAINETVALTTTGTLPTNFTPSVTVTAGSFVNATQYVIMTTGSTDFTLIGAANSNPGTIFTATGVGSGSGTAVSGFYYVNSTSLSGTVVQLCSTPPTLAGPTWTGCTSILAGSAGSGTHTMTGTNNYIQIGGASRGQFQLPQGTWSGATTLKLTWPSASGINHYGCGGSDETGPAILTQSNHTSTSCNLIKGSAGAANDWWDWTAGAY